MYYDLKIVVFMFSEKKCEWTTVGDGCCLDSNQNAYSWYWSSDGDLTTLKKECELQNNCVGIEWGEWNPKGLILIDTVKSNGSGTQILHHVEQQGGKGTISSSGHPCHEKATCYAYKCPIF